MTQTEYYDLLMKDLCGRLHYGTMISINGDNQYLDSIIYDDGYYVNFVGDNKEGYSLYYNDIKPYLFPLSIMTEEQRKEYNSLRSIGVDECGDIIYFDTFESVDMCNKNHFDYRVLIPIGAAIDATGLNIY